MCSGVRLVNNLSLSPSNKATVNHVFWWPNNLSLSPSNKATVNHVFWYQTGKQLCLWFYSSQEKRRSERAEIQRVRTEKDKERQARREVCIA
jgi:hypothetical protein